MKITQAVLDDLTAKAKAVLATFAKIGPQRAGGVRIVALRPYRCLEPRRASVDL